MPTSQTTEETAVPRQQPVIAPEPFTINLRPPRNHVDPRAIRWWTIQGLIGFIPVLVVLVVLAMVFTSLQFWFYLAAVIFAVLGALYVVVVPTWKFRIHRWEMTDIAVYTSSGWLWQEWRVAPLSRVQTVDTERGPIQRVFGLSTVTITTASAAGAIKIEGLDHNVAEDAVARLTSITHATPGDAT